MSRALDRQAAGDARLEMHSAYDTLRGRCRQLVEGPLAEWSPENARVLGALLGLFARIARAATEPQKARALATVVTPGWFGLSVFETKEPPVVLRAAAVEALISQWLPYQAPEPLPKSASAAQVPRVRGICLQRVFAQRVSPKLVPLAVAGESSRSAGADGHGF